MTGVRKVYSVAYVLGLGVFATALAAGVVHSLRLEERLPRVGLPYDGLADHVDMLIERRDFDGAVHQLQLLTRIAPGDHKPHVKLGLILAEQGHLKESADEFAHALRLRPYDAEIHNNLGATYLDAGDLAQAAACFERALKLRPDYPIAWNNLGAALGQQGRLAEAVDCFGQAVRLEPDYAEARSNLDTARQLLAGQSAAAP